MLLKIGSQGEDVKKVQRLLKVTADGSFGPQTKKAVMLWQSKNGLVADGIVGNKTWEKMFPNKAKAIDPSVTYNPINIHITESRGRTIKYIVIHYTAGASSKAGSALANRNVFLNRKASADFIVDDSTIIQVNPDVNNYYTWAVGDGNGAFGITNKNSVSIEICSNLSKGTSAQYPNHEGWSFSEASLNNAITLARILMKTLNLSKDSVVRHFDASRKLCPGIIGWNTGKLYSTDGKPLDMNNESEWIKFKNRL